MSGKEQKHPVPARRRGWPNPLHDNNDKNNSTLSMRIIMTMPYWQWAIVRIEKYMGKRQGSNTIINMMTKATTNSARQHCRQSKLDMVGIFTVRTKSYCQSNPTEIISTLRADVTRWRSKCPQQLVDKHLQASHTGKCYTKTFSEVTIISVTLCSYASIQVKLGTSTQEIRACIQAS